MNVKRDGNEPMHGVVIRSDAESKAAEILVLIEPPLLREMLAGERACIHSHVQPLAFEIEKLRQAGYEFELHVHCVTDIIEWAKANTDPKDELYEQWAGADGAATKRIQ